MKEVEDLLSEPMTREKFAKVLEDFDGASDEVRSLYDLEKTIPPEGIISHVLY